MDQVYGHYGAEVMLNLDSVHLIRRSVRGSLKELSEWVGYHCQFGYHLLTPFTMNYCFFCV